MTFTQSSSSGRTSRITCFLLQCHQLCFFSFFHRLKVQKRELVILHFVLKCLPMQLGGASACSGSAVSSAGPSTHACVFGSDVINLSSWRSRVLGAVIRWRNDRQTNIHPHGGSDIKPPPNHPARCGGSPRRFAAGWRTVAFSSCRTIPRQWRGCLFSLSPQIRPDRFQIFPILQKQNLFFTNKTDLLTSF